MKVEDSTAPQPPQIFNFQSGARECGRRWTAAAAFPMHRFGAQIAALGSLRRYVGVVSFRRSV
jgi:hypothetical protein